MRNTIITLFLALSLFSAYASERDSQDVLYVQMTTSEKLSIIPSCLIGFIGTTGMGIISNIPLLSGVGNIVGIIVEEQTNDGYTSVGNVKDSYALSALLGEPIGKALVVVVDGIITSFDWIKDGSLADGSYNVPFQMIKEEIENGAYYVYTRQMAKSFFEDGNTSCAKYHQILREAQAQGLEVRLWGQE